jgi:hypothetical protein
MMCAEADLPTPRVQSLGIGEVFSILPVKIKDLRVDLGSLLNPSMAHLAAAYVLIVFTLILFSKSCTGTVKG